MNNEGKNNGTKEDPELEGRTIAPLGQILEAYPIFEGESGERKYRVHFYGYDASYLLRLFDESSFASKKAEFEALHRMQSISVHCSRPIAMGQWEAGRLYFQLLSYIEGENAVRALPEASKPQQLRVGIQAGEELRRIGGYDAPEELEPWAERYRRCATRTLARIESANGLPDCARAAVRKVKSGLALVDDRPSVFRHGRYLPSNLIVKSGRLAGVVGFGHFDWGDPVYEFAMLGSCGRNLSPVFCTGQILGYHGGQEPEAEFWKLYSLYAASGALSLIAHALDETPEKLDEAIACLERLARDHEGFSEDSPSWFGAL
ncbi:phosphotransferase family protein [Saccharibacillus sp. O23]|uniref:phosphotransferase family protein n=1 Tax=Saccharibacillus sp. O23 TaxID=2009338 RepID=UPI0015C636DE|nr:aminoglycoside phosphotransferase family protein [Saccharibacillus sp. O23]